MQKELTYQESIELEQFYRDCFQDDVADEIEAYRDYRLDKVIESQEAQLEALNEFTGGGWHD